jgi:hypothetical protein
MARKKFKIPGISFSWKRALGISQAKARLSRKIGIPLSRGARRRKIGQIVERKVGKSLGCMLILVAPLIAVGVYIIIS